MTIIDVGAHIGGIADGVLDRMRPATDLLVGTARVSSSYVDRLLHPSAVDTSTDQCAPRDRVIPPRNEVVIVPRALTRC
ncbi:MAG: hypothetical protein JHC55_16795 [Mycolicibacterium sp.]|nr:hypothetical protein [Mycolicibacterium sp.]